MVHFQSMFVGSIFSITSFLMVHQQLSYREQLSKKWKLRSTYCWLWSFVASYFSVLFVLVFVLSLLHIAWKIMVHCFFIFCWSFIFLFIFIHFFFVGSTWLTFLFSSFRLFFPSYIFIVFLEGQINEAMDSFKKQSNYTSSQQQVKISLFSNEYLFMLSAFPFNFFSHYDTFWFFHIYHEYILYGLDFNSIEFWWVCWN